MEVSNGSNDDHKIDLGQHFLFNNSENQKTGYNHNCRISLKFTEKCQDCDMTYEIEIKQKITNQEILKPENVFTTVQSLRIHVKQNNFDENIDTSEDIKFPLDVQIKSEAEDHDDHFDENIEDYQIDIADTKDLKSEVENLVLKPHKCHQCNKTFRLPQSLKGMHIVFTSKQRYYLISQNL